MKEGWKIYQLGEIVTFDKRFKGIDRTKQKNIVTFNHVSAELLKSLPVDGGDVKLLATGLFDGYTTIEKAADKINNGEVITIPTGGNANIKYYKGLFVDSGNILAVSKRDDIYLKYVWYYLYFRNEFLESCFKGTSIKHPYMPDIWELDVLIPSLSEQERIVSFLDAEFAKIDALKANTEQQLKAAKDLFQSAVKLYLTPKDGWEKKELGKLCNICGRIGFRGYTTKDMVGGPSEGAITLSPSNIVDGRMDYTKCQYISWYKYEESPEIMVQNGDVLIVKTGSSYGKSALVKDLPHKATINPQSVVIKNIKINNGFFAYLIRTPYVQKEFDGFVAGTAIPTFSQANLSKVVLSFPSNKEQEHIVTILDSLSERVKFLQANYNQTITLCNDLKQSLLKSIFE